MYKTLHKPGALLLAALWLGTAAAGARPEETGVAAGASAPLRELNTDRPDATESPVTVDAGHAQLEMDLANWTHDRQDGTRTVAWEAAPFNLRLGLTPNFELGVFLVPFRREEQTLPGGQREIHSGVGELTLRAKWNFCGNDGTGPALGLITDLKLPTAAAAGIGNGAVEGTLLLPVGLKLGGGWDLGAMTGVDLRLRDSGHGRQGVWINSVTTGHDLTEMVAGYVELTSETGAGTQVATFDAGLTFKLDANTQVDVGAQFGLSRAADDLMIFTGLARRF